MSNRSSNRVAFPKSISEPLAFSEPLSLPLPNTEPVGESKPLSHGVSKPLSKSDAAPLRDALSVANPNPFSDSNSPADRSQSDSYPFQPFERSAIGFLS